MVSAVASTSVTSACSTIVKAPWRARCQVFFSATSEPYFFIRMLSVLILSCSYSACCSWRRWGSQTAAGALGWSSNRCRRWLSELRTVGSGQLGAFYLFLYFKPSDRRCVANLMGCIQFLLHLLDLLCTMSFSRGAWSFYFLSGKTSF